MSILDRESTVAPAGYSRWLIPPAALAVHLSIGQVYAFSVFVVPLTRLIGIKASVPGSDWTQSQIAWIFSIAIVFLGGSAAIFGRWVERSGPRKTMLASALCFGGGFAIAALGVHLHQLWLIYFGYGAVGGCGLGLGYIAPVSTLVKWFPDRPGMATGMAIMGFGGGAFIGSNLSLALMTHFQEISKTAAGAVTNTGVAPAFLIMGAIYAVFIIFGSIIVRVPAADWKPAGYVPPAARQGGMITSAQVPLDQAWRTPQFWLLWIVLCLNVTAGIGILEHASPMIQEIFKSKVTAATAGGFVALLSLFNMAGRFVWSSFSDVIGRKQVYAVYLLLGAVLYLTIPFAGHAGNVILFVTVTSVIISMYGGGFATAPAYLKDLFGTMHVGAIHGRLLTAWSVAGVLGPVLVNRIRDHAIANHASGVGVYSSTMYVMAGLLLVGLICNLSIRPVAERYYHRETGGSAPQPGMSSSQATPYAPGTPS
jgi:MFS family permease